MQIPQLWYKRDSIDLLLNLRFLPELTSTTPTSASLSLIKQYI